MTRLPYESTKADRLLVSVSEHPKDIDWAFSEFERHRGAPSNKALQLSARSVRRHRTGLGFATSISKSTGQSPPQDRSWSVSR